ncbi:hypothetical protein OS493_023873 [Desmophyllum pertusum]|uniref:Heat shock 70 kDa protein 12A n=1 Tax=Desmophyllum pertusum TaxID=174260 RepID=A0A9W9YDL7_9CNID|nr:hypothetical protein OS493_023873 [Desmophyllum pertusum]
MAQQASDDLRFVVAIDLGTTYSCYAFSPIKDQGRDSIFMNRDWTNDDGVRTSKTPTCLLLKSDLSFDSFGYEAVQKYTGHQDKCRKGGYLFFQHFKMALHSDETINTETTIKASNGQLVKAKTVIATSINFLKKEALKVIRTQTGDISANDILWVLTVPAIWTPRAKQFMREVAYEAGLGSPDNPNQVLIALEPEAIFCLTKDMSTFKSEPGCISVKRQVFSQPNTHFMVVDIGGTTLDVTVHAFKEDGAIKEIHKVTGSHYGGIYVNQRFESLLEELFGAQELQTYRKQFPSHWLRLMSEFESKKRGERILDDTAMINIRLPRSFVRLVNQTRSPAMARYGEKEVKLEDEEYLSLSSGMMKKLFTPVMESIKKHLKTLLKKPQLSEVKTIFLVGGFADSVLLQNEIEREFSKGFRVLIPNCVSLAVVHGAVIFGKEPSKITEIVVGTTYGANCARDFIPGVYPEEKKFSADGIEKCGGLFNLFVKQNAVVRIREKTVTSKYTLLRATDTEINFSFYASTNPDAKYITDPGMTKLGSVMDTSPDTWRGKDREIEVSMYFGGTEITATARDISSGNVCSNHP